MLFRINKEKIILNDASIERIQPKYKEVLDEIGKICLKEFGQKMQSLYVRGSVSSGLAIPFASDIDIVAIVKKNIGKIKLKFVGNIIKELEKKYPFVTMIDLTVISSRELFFSCDYSKLRVYLKTQSVCLWGQDIVKKIPSYKADRNLFLIMHNNLENELLELHNFFSCNIIDKKYQNSLRPTEFWCVWTMRTILRASLGLIMVKKPYYSPDLKTCRDIFVKEYPSFRNDMNIVFEWALNPTSDKKEICDFLGQFIPKFMKLYKELVLNN